MKALLKNLLTDLISFIKTIWFFILFCISIYVLFQIIQSLILESNAGPGDSTYYQIGDDPIKEEQRYER